MGTVSKLWSDLVAAVQAVLLGVFTAMTIAFSGLAVVSGWLFRRGRWKTKTV